MTRDDNLASVLQVVSWENLGSLRKSFIGRALTIVSLGVGVLVNFPQLETLLGQLKIGIFGSFLFLTGTLIYFFRVVPEFSKRHEINELLAEYDLRSTRTFFAERLSLAQSMQSRLSNAEGNWFVPSALVLLLGTRISAALESCPKPRHWQEAAKDMYFAELTIRNLDRPISRIVVALALYLGAFGMLFPVLGNICRLLFGS